MDNASRSEDNAGASSRFDVDREFAQAGRFPEAFPMQSLSLVIPAFNEQESIRQVVAGLREQLKSAGIEHEIIVVVDGATDGTAGQAAMVADQVIEHPVQRGYGRSLKKIGRAHV